MWGVLVLLQLARAAGPANPRYATPELASFIAEAAKANRTPPASLVGYDAHVESELSLILRDTLGREHIAQVEQLALGARWRRGGDYGLHVLGYRSASVGVPYSALSLASGWTVPFLYGDRLALGVDVRRIAVSGHRRDSEARVDTTTSSRPRQPGPPSLRAVHPLASDRDRFYRFAGGDTIAFVRSAHRVVPLVRVRVTPVLDSVSRDSSLSVFDGEIDFDATRHQIVRMRGRFVTRLATRRGLRATLSQLPGVVAVAFVEFVNAEVDERYWLPQFQRTEFQATFAPLGGQRSVFRVLSRFSDLSLEATAAADTTPDRLSPQGLAEGAETRATSPVLTYATSDSISRFGRWQQALGTATSEVSASDFNDFLPDAWRPFGPPRLEFAPAKLDEVFRYDRVEGAYIGAAVGVRFRDAAPGVSARAYGGWAFTEQTARGGAAVTFARGRRTAEARVERLLVSTNDFTAPVNAGTIGFTGLLGADDQDYVDRRVAATSLTTSLRSVSTGIFTAEAGVGEDVGEVAHRAWGPFGGSFRVNRWSANGKYVRGAATLEWHPDVTALFLEPGAGFVASYEIGRGQLNWQRAALTVALRRSLNEVVVAGRAQGGIVAGRDIPPQQLYELGGEGVLPGYAYKEFAGDRAAAAGVLVSYTLPYLRRPWRLVRSLMVPGLSPGLAGGVESGWTEASSASVLQAIRRLDPLAPTSCIENPTAFCPPPLSIPSGRVRATADVRLTAFGGLLGIGVARPIDRAARWRFVFRFGQEY